MALSVSRLLFGSKKDFRDEKHVKIFSGHIYGYRDSSTLRDNQETNASKNRNEMKIHHRRHHRHSVFPRKSPAEWIGAIVSTGAYKHFAQRKRILSIHGRYKKNKSLSRGVPSPTKYCTKIPICPTVRLLSDASGQ